uniref:Large ribosomal subunit protein uL18c n=3 Tax=Alaria TaxID=2888 RepID=A0A8F0FBR1_ALAMR|nr:ribosomal protein L18 [Alaria crispa]YP_010206685.1 ribosomal protein L18 [Alaria marginata]YP_010206826.1 ribosomal protein L18 [Alaria esculenta]YP_010207108.1 ribosomal protein L18 [Alaria praelonga]UAX21987.1 ribosomal protein L18 [Alaria sp. PI001]UAX22128.1 ribosomal protein L18 [Alaria sp. PI20]UAX22551.1 ribosomal protein L18 [Alaria sp. TTB000023]UAX22692.1 ribosomal protein L18 [Alaria sp. TTB000026]UAX22833.1 ribosomal protein L18 [Alaria sp. TTB000053]
MGKREKKIIKGNNLKPRLAVFRSNKHIYAQVIDDSCSKTIISCSTLELEVKAKCEKTSNKLASKIVGEIIGKRLLEENIKEIIFDRGKKSYHGRIKELAEGARLVGLSF